jgi:hypothetical protein
MATFFFLLQGCLRCTAAAAAVSEPAAAFGLLLLLLQFVWPLLLYEALLLLE